MNMAYTKGMGLAVVNELCATMLERVPIFDLTKYCALCGGQLQYSARLDVRRLPTGERNDSREWVEDDLEDACCACACESRELKGRCGECRVCKVAQHGCACDGAYDAGCFNCTPKKFERPSCPKENFNHL